MRIVKQLTNNRFLNIKEVNDPELGCSAYQFAERKGVDSIALICYDKKTNRFLLNKEATPPTGGFMIRAFGGSIDKEKSYIDIAKDEVKEECGYDIPTQNIRNVGEVFVSTQMNQFCHLFLVTIYEKYAVEREPENATEAMAETVWLTEEEIMQGNDWKAITIICKAKAKGYLV
jgi:hypothetical protein